MAITALPYAAYLSMLALGQVDLNSDELRFVLLTSNYEPAQLAQVNYSQVSAFEINGAGYTAGGEMVENRTYDGTQPTPNTVLFVLSADPVVWTGLTATFRFAVLYNVTKGNLLIGYIDFGEDLVYDNATFTLDLTDGFLTFASV